MKMITYSPTIGQIFDTMHDCSIKILLLETVLSHLKQRFKAVLFDLSTLFHCSSRIFPGCPTCRGLLNSLLTLAGMELGRGERGGGSAMLSNNFRFDCLDVARALALGVTGLTGSPMLETFNFRDST